MRMQPYNGHTNYETWLMVLWFENYEDMGEWVDEAGRDPRKLASSLEDMIEVRMPDLDAPWEGFLHAAISEVDWRGVAKYFVRQWEVAEPVAQIAEEATE